MRGSASSAAASPLPGQLDLRLGLEVVAAGILQLEIGHAT